MRIFLILLFSFISPMSLANDFAARLVQAALERTEVPIRYDSSYHKLTYPNGDVPADIGVCSDVIIRIYRKLGIDLQVLVHEDMQDNFNHYPSRRIWGLSQTDRNIDHRRVHNLRTFFSRHAISLPVSEHEEDYLGGDIVTWMPSTNRPHIGIVVNHEKVTGSRPLIVHNIGAGPVLDDMLFDFEITGHFRFQPVTEEINDIR